MFARTSPNAICARCLARRFLTTTSTPSITTVPPAPPPSGFAKLTNRRLLAIHGHDATHFLQGLTTQNIRPGQTTGFYSAFLNAPGRVLHDVFIYPTTHSKSYTSTLNSPSSLSPQVPDPSYLIEVDAAEASRLLAHIKKYKLRAKFTARLVDPGEWDVWSIWSSAEEWTPHPSAGSHPSSDNSAIGCPDGRAPGMGRRLILPRFKTPSDSDISPDHDNPDETTLDAYTIRRLLLGVPEGQAEILRETALPQESNMDYMGAIDFRKGCYVGQELTIRTHHTGVVRKRILPVQVYPAEDDGSKPPERLEYDAQAKVVLPPQATNISRVGARGRSAGKWVSGVGNIGLAICRLEIMTDVVVTGEGSQWSPEQEFKIAWAGEEGRDGGEVRVKAFVPSWHRNRVGVRDLHRERIV